MAKIQVVEGTRVVPNMAGTKLVADVLDAAKVFDLIPNAERGERGPETFPNGQLLKIATASLASGHPDFIDVEEFRVNGPEFYGSFLGDSNGKLPCESSFRMRLNTLGEALKDGGYELLRKGNCSLLKTFAPDLGHLPCGRIPVDIDVSTADNSNSHKEGVSKTYQKYDGYAPMFSYIGSKGFPLTVELRPGKQHCQKGTPAFLVRVMEDARRVTDEPLLYRMDSGNDSLENYQILIKDPNASFIVKRNFRRAPREEIATHLMVMADKNYLARPGKRVYIGHTFHTFSTPSDEAGQPEEFMSLRVTFEITERTMTPWGQTLITPEVEIDMYYNTLGMEEATDEQVIEMYHNHGLSEQFHSEFKTDMDFERYPSGKFATNALLLQLATLAFNSLRIIESLAREMPEDSPIHFRDTMRRRLKTIIERLILVPANFAVHGRRKRLILGRNDPWRTVFLYVNRRIEDFA